MNRERIDELWLRRLSGETLSADEDRELLDALKQDPKLLVELRADERTEALLQLAGRTRADEARFVRRFEARVAAENDAGRFAQRVQSRVSRAEANPWRVPLIAAAAILALLAIVVLRPREPRPEPTVKIPSPQEPAPVRMPAPVRPDEPPPKPKEDDLRARTDADLRKAIEDRKPAPGVKVPMPEEPRVEPPVPTLTPVKEPEKREATRAVVATLVETRGKVFVNKSPATTGAGIL